MARNDNWLDVLTDGRLLRNWGVLALGLPLSVMYYTVIITLFVFSIVLLPVLIGIPLLLFTLASVRALAGFDHRLMTMMLDIDAPSMVEDVDPRGANLGERLGMYLGNPVTWRALIYLAAKLPITVMTFAAAWLALPLLFIEMLILAPLGIDMHLLSPRLTRFTARGSHDINSFVLPLSRRKRYDARVSRLETVYEDEARYYMDDDGEIGVYKRGAQ